MRQWDQLPVRRQFIQRSLEILCPLCETAAGHPREIYGRPWPSFRNCLRMDSGVISKRESPLICGSHSRPFNYIRIFFDMFVSFQLIRRSFLAGRCDLCLIRDLGVPKHGPQAAPRPLPSVRARRKMNGHSLGRNHLCPNWRTALGASVDHGGEGNEAAERKEDN